MYYNHKKADGKNSKVYYYTTSYIRLLAPKWMFRRRLKAALQSIESRDDRAYIIDRVEYYNKLAVHTRLPSDAEALSKFRRKGKNSVYFFDTFEYIRWFKPSLTIKHVFGDITEVPPYPALLKSRPIEGDNANSVVLNLDKVRHFTFLEDKKTFREKANVAIYRGHISGKPHRIKFIETFFNHPMCDVGVISPEPEFPLEWSHNKRITLWEHLNYKFIVTLEGNDVASNLKWVMSSNSVAVMPRPIYETWFMEGRLIPNVHYIEIKDDYSDLVSRVKYYVEHPEEAEKIVENAHAYVEQFFNPEREDLISLKVLDKYFEMTEQ